MPASRRATKAVMKFVKDVGAEVDGPAVVEIDDGAEAAADAVGGDEVAAKADIGDGFGVADEAEDDWHAFGVALAADDLGFGYIFDGLD